MPTLFTKIFTLLVFSLPIISAANAADEKNENKQTTKQAYQSCLFKTIKQADSDMTFSEVEQFCGQLLATKNLNEDNDKAFELGAVSNRLIQETKTSTDPYVLTPHKMNYFMPVSIVDEINRDAYSQIGTWQQDLQDVEAKFQLSLKIPLLKNHLFNDSDQIFFAFTLQSWWQIYADDISRPFRETNYQPEFVYFTPINFHPFNGNSALAIGLEHQSNGHSQLLSRSWNRLFINYLYEKRNFALSLRPWYRIPENEKSSPTSGTGDDNPDILDYMGHFELELVYKYSKYFEVYFKGRNNFATHNGFMELGTTFPLWGKLKGYAQFSSGYGESLIDYNVNQKRLGIGIALTNIL